MKKNLSAKEYVYVASMLFGLFFGAGNLIFPVHMGQLAGRNIIPRRHRLHHHGRGAAADGRRRARCQQMQRAL